MEKHTCKLCSRSFANGRALGGHMRSHMATPQPPKPQVRNETPSTSSSSSSSSSEEEEEEDDDDEAKGVFYGLRENPKKSIRVVDPEFSFAVDAGSVVQDRESETESSKAPSRRRSKRNRKSVDCDKLKLKAEVEADPEPLSSVSDTTPEEDVALSLMMLSRDIWMRDAVKLRFEESDESEEMKFCARGRSRYQCGTCKKVFRSYQALGGHRASHKKIRGCLPPATSTSPVLQETESEGRNDTSPGQHKIHECPVCFRVFGSGQALGGHKRSHLSGSATPITTTTKFGDNLIDLNLPPVDDDDASQIELSAVSDAEFVDAAGT